MIIEIDIKKGTDLVWCLETVILALKNEKVGRELTFDEIKKIVIVEDKIVNVITS